MMRRGSLWGRRRLLSGAMGWMRGWICWSVLYGGKWVEALRRPELLLSVLEYLWGVDHDITGSLYPFTTLNENHLFTDSMF